VLAQVGTQELALITTFYTCTYGCYNNIFVIKVKCFQKPRENGNEPHELNAENDTTVLGGGSVQLIFFLICRK
jgi:hypothetical protein